MKLFIKLCLAALLVGFLTSPLIAKSKHRSEESESPRQSYKEPPASPPGVPIPYPNTGSQKSPEGAKKKTQLHDINIEKILDKSSP
jgi:hypothetical protein